MKAAEWKRLVRPLLPPDEEWGFKGSLCYRRPFNGILFGVLDEASGHGGGKRNAPPGQPSNGQPQHSAR